MDKISEIVKNTLKAGYISRETEYQLQRLLDGKYGLEDFQAFMELQWAVMDGKVKQESLELGRQWLAKDKLNALTLP
ncbi:MAG: hypothetical protein AB4352_01985 [Hormoscilla sp.]